LSALGLIPRVTLQASGLAEEAAEEVATVAVVVPGVDHVPCRHCLSGNASRKREGCNPRPAPDTVSTTGAAAFLDAFLEQCPVVHESSVPICTGCLKKYNSHRAKGGGKSAFSKGKRGAGSGKGGVAKGGRAGSGKDSAQAGRGGRGGAEASTTQGSGTTVCTTLHHGLTHSCAAQSRRHPHFQATRRSFRLHLVAPCSSTACRCAASGLVAMTRWHRSCHTA